MSRRGRALALGLSVAAQPALAQPFPAYDDPVLARGRAVWIATCSACHANSMADAPQVRDPSAWKARLAKPRAALYESALRGRKDGELEMPPRGGNASLSDDEVRAAVDYMVRFATEVQKGK